MGCRHAARSCVFLVLRPGGGSWREAPHGQRGIRTCWPEFPPAPPSTVRGGSGFRFLLALGEMVPLRTAQRAGARLCAVNCHRTVSSLQTVGTVWLVWWRDSFNNPFSYLGRRKQEACCF